VSHGGTDEWQGKGKRPGAAAYRRTGGLGVDEMQRWGSPFIGVSTGSGGTASTRPWSNSMSAHTWAQVPSMAAAAARLCGGNKRAVCLVAAGGDEVDECRC
jgi:hypothetical protein